jgi:hypothetical protein
VRVCVDRRRIVGQLRVQEIFLSGGRRSWTVLWPEGAVHEEADRFLRRYDGEPGTQRTYAYLMVDHLRWLEREALQLNAVRLRDLQRYMGLVGAAVRMPLGEPWRAGKQPYGAATLGAAASVLKGFYLGLAHEQVSVELRRDLDRTRLPSKVDPEPVPAGARQFDDAGQPAGAAQGRSAASEDAAGRGPGPAVAEGVDGSRPHDRDVAV